MSEEMAVGDITTPVEAKLNGDEAVASAVEGEGTSSKRPDEPPAPETMETTPPDEDVPVPEIKTEAEEPDIKPVIEASDIKPDIEASDKKPDIQVLNIKSELDVPETTEYRGTKRRASAAFSDNGEEFRGFDDEAAVEEDFRGFDIVDEKDLSVDYSRVLERLEAEVSAAVASFTPLRSVMATPPVPPRAAKRPRKDTDGSRPSSALSSRSEDAVSVETTKAHNNGISTASSPASRGRRATTEISSPLLRVPLERGWKRELVYRAALDSHSRRNADIYYYTPQGKKLRSTREVSEQLPGTGLTLDNFSFFKEPLGVDDPEREIIRDAKMMRRVESPVSAPAPIAAEGKRTPKPKAPKGASPEHATPKSPPIKIRVKSVGSRLSNSAPAPAPPAAPAAKQRKPAGDNNNSAAWKKPKQPPHAAAPAPGTPPLQPVPPPQPPPLQSRPQQQTATDVKSPRQAVQPCSLTCGRGVPSLACGACLCLYHPHCAGHQPATHTTFFCKNCRTSPSAPSEPPPLIHKSGVPAASVGAAVATPVARRAAPATHTRSDKRVLLRMKVAGGGPDGERLWAVAKPQPTVPKPQPVSVPIPVPVPVPRPRPVAAVPAAPRPLSVRGALPQTIAILNGRRFIVVPKNMVQPSVQHEARTRGRLANGASSPPELLSPRRRGRTRQDDTDYFTAFYNKAHEKSYNVVTQIFQYLGMRDLAMCARVCRLWRQLAATPALWRHVRMKNSHVSDWGGLCSALKRHGTKRLDLRKMLLPQNDAVFWEQFAEHIATVDTLERIEMCRCPASAVESVCRGLPSLRALSALAIRDALLDPSPLGALPLLHELRLKSMSGLSLTRDLMPLAALTHLQHLSLTSIKELGWSASEVVGRLEQLESLELGECTFRAEFAQVLGRLTRLRRLRLERGTAHCAAPALLRALATLPLLARLELVNIDVKVGFDDALAECRNIQRLLIIPTYVSQSATTNKQVLSGVLRLKDTLTHLMWGVTIELLRVTELFIDQCEQAGEAPRRDVGECIPVLKPVPGCRLPLEHRHVGSPPQVEILPLPTLQRLLSAQLPNTKLKLLRIPFHATWRQSLADFQ